MNENKLIVTTEEILQNLLWKFFKTDADIKWKQFITQYFESNHHRTVKFIQGLLHEFWNRSSDACPLEASEQERQELAWRQFIKEKFE